MGNETTESDFKIMTAQLREIAKWARLQGIQKAREILTEVLKRDSEKLGYEFSDGRGSADVGKVAGVSDFAIRSYWKKWAALGLVVPSEKYRGRYERLFSLAELGLDVPISRESTDTPLQEPGESGGGEERHDER